MKKIKSIVFLGYSGFPYGLAEVQKIILISKSLILTGNHVTVICRNGFHNKIEHPEMKVSGAYEDIEYVYTSGSCFRNEHFIKRRLFEIKGKINEVLFLRNRKRDNKLDYAIISQNFYAILYYSFLSKFFGFKIILNYVEYYSGIKKKWFQIDKWFNDILFDRFAPLLVDAVFPISEFLIDHIKKVSPGKKYLKIPGLTDFEKYNDIEILQDQKYFLFCGDAVYKEIIQFIIDSFGQLNNNTSIFLYLVINGDENNIIEIKKYISNHLQKEKIKLFSKLTEKQLFTYYKNAIALLIPLRPTFQDIARFPHKTGEYLASGNPVISTNYGEVKYYFKDMENMLLADSYDINLFAEKMQYVIDNPIQAKQIGISGQSVASRIFDYRNMAPVINNFLNLQF
jgi:glycosyltransferase involved in cell wall biosynthesis